MQVSEGNSFSDEDLKKKKIKQQMYHGHYCFRRKHQFYSTEISLPVTLARIGRN